MQREDSRHTTGAGVCPCQRQCVPSGGPLAQVVGQGSRESCEHQPFPLPIAFPSPPSGHPFVGVSGSDWGGPPPLQRRMAETAPSSQFF